jgi:O-Antigen ligase
VTRARVTDFLFFATVFCVTFEKVRWNVGGTVNLADILTILFLLAFLGERLARSDRRLPRTALVVLVFLVGLLLVYLIGFFNIQTHQALSQFGKGLAKFLVHFLFLAAGVAYLARRSERFYWRTLGWFAAGMTANAAYGAIQLLDARRGGNLDKTVLSPLTGGASSINVYGVVGGENVYRPNALTGDPNHLGVMLVIPLLVLAPIYLRMERTHRLRVPIGVLLAFLLVVELATLSRSGVLGLLVGLVVLALPYRGRLFSRAMLLPVAGVALVILYEFVKRPQFFETVVRSRTQTGGGSTSVHFAVYDFIPQILRSHPLFGLGLNNFSVYYEFVTGKTNWGPHSFYVALVVETGVVGTLAFLVFLGYVFWRLSVAIRLGKMLAAAGDWVAARVRPLAWGLTAALAGTMAANFFYLTMQFYYFYAFVMLALAVPIVFGRRLVPARV